jgi:hypothetical protein
MRLCGFGLSRSKRNFIVSSCSVKHRRFYYILFVFWVPSLALRLPVLVPASQGNFPPVRSYPPAFHDNFQLVEVTCPSLQILFFFSLLYKENNRLCHERLCPENKDLHLMFYYELKLYWIQVCWLYERSETFSFQIKFSNHLRIHCTCLEIETIVSLSFL